MINFVIACTILAAVLNAFCAFLNYRMLKRNRRNAGINAQNAHTNVLIAERNAEAMEQVVEFFNINREIEREEHRGLH